MAPHSQWTCKGRSRAELFSVMQFAAEINNSKKVPAVKIEQRKKSQLVIIELLKHLNIPQINKSLYVSEHRHISAVFHGKIKLISDFRPLKNTSTVAPMARVAL